MIQQRPKIGMWSDLLKGSSGWDKERNFNSDRLDQLVFCSITDELADPSLLPVSAPFGTTYYIQSNQRLYTYYTFGNTASWFSGFTPIGGPIYNITLDSFYYFDGVSLVPMPGGSSGVLTLAGFYVDNTDIQNPIVTVPRINVTTVAPTVTDDETQSYAVGSLWFNETNSTAWICKDATTGAAVWQAATNNFVTNINPTVTDDEANGWYVGAAWLNTVSGVYFVCTDVTAGAAVWTIINGSSVSNYVLSASSGGSISPALGTGPVTNFSESFTVSGLRPVEIRVVPDGSANAARFGNQNTGSSDMEFDVICLRNGTEFARQRFRIAGENPAGTDLASYPGPGSILFVDEPGAGTYTYSIELEAISATTGGRILWSKMYIKEA